MEYSIINYKYVIINYPTVCVDKQHILEFFSYVGPNVIFNPVLVLKPFFVITFILFDALFFEI